MRTSRPGRMRFFWGMQVRAPAGCFPCFSPAKPAARLVTTQHACAPPPLRAQDPMSGAHIASELHRRYDQYGLQLTECHDMGHWPHLENPERVARAITGFLLEDYQAAPGAWQAAYRKLLGEDSSHRVSVYHGVVQSQGFVPSSFRRKSNSIDRGRQTGSAAGVAAVGGAVQAVGPGSGSGAAPVGMRRQSSSTGMLAVTGSDPALGAIQESASEAHPHAAHGEEGGEGAQQGAGAGGAGMAAVASAPQLHVPDGAASSSGGQGGEAGGAAAELVQAAAQGAAGRL